MIHTHTQQPDITFNIENIHVKQRMNNKVEYIFTVMGKINKFFIILIIDCIIIFSFLFFSTSYYPYFLIDVCSTMMIYDILVVMLLISLGKCLLSSFRLFFWLPMTTITTIIGPYFFLLLIFLLSIK